jgi:hypothetical protein
MGVNDVSTAPERKAEFIPKTALVKKLVDIRRRAIASGMKLLSSDEILDEIHRRRGEVEDYEANLR